MAVAEVGSVTDAIRLAGAWLREQFPGEPLRAVGHRVVHGGADYAQPVLVDDTVFAALEQLIPLAPLHQPHNLAAIRAVREIAAGVTAGRLFRYGVSPQPSATCRSVCAAAGTTTRPA